jgi:hypothetical protein
MTETTPTGATKRALRALVADDPVDGSTAEGPERVVAEAVRATERVEHAVEFLAADGVERLARAVVTAARSGDEATVRRGRGALSTLRAFRAALDGPTGGVDDDCGDRGELRRATPDTGSRTATATNHFHSGRGTVLGGGGKRRDR